MMSKEMRRAVDSAKYYLDGKELDLSPKELNIEPGSGDKLRKAMTGKVVISIGMCSEGAKQLSSMINAIMEREQRRLEREIERELIKELLKTEFTDVTAAATDTDHGKPFGLPSAQVIKMAQDLEKSIRMAAAAFGETIEQIQPLAEGMVDMYQELREFVAYDPDTVIKKHTEQHDRRYANAAALKSLKASRRPEVKIKGYRHMYKCRR